MEVLADKVHKHFTQPHYISSRDTLVSTISIFTAMYVGMVV